MSAVIFVGLCSLASLPGQSPSPLAERTPESATATIVLKDGSELYVEPRESMIHLVTQYGKLAIDRRDIVSIDFGLPTPLPLQQRLAVAERDIAQRGADSESWSVLADAREYAYPVLQRLVESRVKGVAERAAGMMRQLREAHPPERLQRIDRDRVRTRHSRYVGRIENRSIEVSSRQFGNLKLATEHLARLTLTPIQPKENVAVHAAPDPGNLVHHANVIGQVFHFVVTGQAGGAVWGSDVYTTDSTLGAVAVHAGVLKLGETGVVQVTILPGQNAYEGSTRHGITTMPYGPYPSSFSVSKPVRALPEDDDP
ncbi:MAG: LCCL domain-containing protein [Gemmataceae bacterium]|nr:LCCL domain-containing protein [Gemmataceae bacterium]